MKSTMSLHIQTPLIPSYPLSLVARRSILLKLDLLQPPGSFKIRGIGFACEEYLRQGARRFISSSGGNAGLAVAYAGRMLSTPVMVVVPETTPSRAKELLRLEKAEVIVHGASWQEANEFALSMVSASDAFIHPFDDPLLWQGHATLIDEVFQSGVKPDAIVLSVGGGGLLSGVAEGLHRNGWSDIPILAVETEGAASFHQAMQAQQRVALESITSVATSLGAKRICERAFQWSKERIIRSIVVSDQSALSACERFLADHRLLVEPACGASLALAYEKASALEDFNTVLFVVCGGATATIEQIKQWSEKYAQR